MKYNLVNFYPFHLEKDFVDGYKRIIKKFTNSISIERNQFPETTDRETLRNFFRKHLEILDSYSALQLEKDVLRRIESKKSDKLDLEKADTILARKYFRNETAKKILEEENRKRQKRFRQDADLAIPSLIGQPGITESVLEEILESNVNLITTLEKQHLATVKNLLYSGLQNGKSYSDIAKEIAEATGATLEKAQFWATDQASKFFGKVNRIRQKAIGFPGFIWVAVKDSRVRVTHLAFEGKYYDWEKGTGETNRKFPGDDYRCRCFARPAFPEDADPNYQINAEQRRWAIAGETQAAQRAFDEFYARLTREAEETVQGQERKLIEKDMELKNHFQSWSDNLQPNEAAAFRAYKLNGYKSINEALRSNQEIPTYSNEYKYIKGMESAFEKAPLLEESLTVYRGVHSEFAESLWNMDSGKIYTEKGFFSSSLSEQKAIEASRDKLVIKTKLKKGTNAIYMESVTSAVSNEYEMLVNKGHKFRIKKKYMKNNIRYIEVEML